MVAGLDPPGRLWTMGKLNAASNSGAGEGTGQERRPRKRVFVPVERAMFLLLEAAEEAGCVHLQRGSMGADGPVN